MRITEVILLIIVMIMIYSVVSPAAEHWKPCSDCNKTPLPLNGMVQLNAAAWPYSAFANPDSIYLPPGTKSAPKRSAPLTHLETPDHMLLTN